MKAGNHVIEAFGATRLARQNTTALVATPHRPVIVGSRLAWLIESLSFTRSGFFQS